MVNTVEAAGFAKNLSRRGNPRLSACPDQVSHSRTPDNSARRIAAKRLGFPRSDTVFRPDQSGTDENRTGLTPVKPDSEFVPRIAGTPHGRDP